MNSSGTIAHHAAETPAPVGPAKRWSTAEFDRLLAEGFLREGSRAYLWDGAIIEPMAENPPHINAVANLYRILMSRLADDSWTINQVNPIALADGFKPQPDLAVLQGPRDRYEARIPNPADVALLVEVSDSTNAKDAGEFLRKYAEAGIILYWIVNIPGRRVEVYSDPLGASGYQVRQTYSLDDQVPLTLIADGMPTTIARVSVREVLRHSLSPADQGK